MSAIIHWFVFVYVCVYVRMWWLRQRQWQRRQRSCLGCTSDIAMSAGFWLSVGGMILTLSVSIGGFFAAKGDASTLSVIGYLILTLAGVTGLGLVLLVGAILCTRADSDDDGDDAGNNRNAEEEEDSIDHASLSHSQSSTQVTTESHVSMDEA